MKKRCIVLIAAAMFIMGGTAYAGALATGGTTSGGVEILGTKTGGSASSIGKLSNNVALGVAYVSTTYAFTTKHANGTKSYGSSAGDTKLYYQEVNKTASVTAPSANDSSAFSSGWSVL